MSYLENLCFMPIGHIPQKQKCHHCGKKTPAEGWLAADIRIIGTRDAVTFVVCSEACEEKFMNHPKAEEYITDVMFRVMMRMEGLTNDRQIPIRFRS